MDDLEAKLNSVLNDPAAMQKIMAMAQSLSAAAPPENQEATPGGELPQLDPGMLQKLSGLMGKTSVDSQQKTLLHALQPYLSSHRIQKLERAMQAAKMARIAATFLGQQGFLKNAGR